MYMDNIVTVRDRIAAYAANAVATVDYLRRAWDIATTPDAQEKYDVEMIDLIAPRLRELRDLCDRELVALEVETKARKRRLVQARAVSHGAEDVSPTTDGPFGWWQWPADPARADGATHITYDPYGDDFAGWAPGDAEIGWAVKNTRQLWERDQRRRIRV